ncbi:MAG: MBL fold metallo-hydrolase [Oscillospiraceae bacterium]|nr:MBL fold metallo-hydrolase [Oscillospiraceae bacterium]
MEKKYGVSLKWLAVTSFEMRFGNTTVVSDPYITECVGTDVTWENVENCDIICLGHAHWDHITDIPRLMDKFHPILLCGDQTAMPMAQWLNCSPTVVYPMYPDNELDFGDVKIRALYGRHTNLGSGFNDLCARLDQNPLCQADPGMAALQPVGSFEYRNFLFTLPNGTKVLLWGNDPTIEQVNICKALKPDIAIIQRSTKPEAIAQKAEFAAAIGCKVLIPHHHDFRAVDDPAIVETFRKEFLDRVPDGVFIAPEHGQWIDL